MALRSVLPPKRLLPLVVHQLRRRKNHSFEAGRRLLRGVGTSEEEVAAEPVAAVEA